MSEIHALAAREPKGKLAAFSYDPGPLGDDQVEIEVQYCGLCHSDYSMFANEWGMTKYPFVPGHEAIGKVVAVGSDAKSVEIGQTVGLGWNSGSCLHCKSCLTGDHNMCYSLQQTIVGRHGAFATRVRCHWVWATPIPAGVDPAKAGPLLCGGITVFNPLVQFDVKPTDRVGVIGIGGLGHMALQFMNKWGCHVTAFTTSDSKTEEAKRMGAHAVLNTRSEDQLKKAAGSFDFDPLDCYGQYRSGRLPFGFSPARAFPHGRRSSRDQDPFVPAYRRPKADLGQPLWRSRHGQLHARFLRPA